MFKMVMMFFVLMSFKAFALEEDRGLEQFNTITNKVLSLYSNDFGKKLVVKKRWEDDSLKVEPRDMEDHFSLYIAGGIFRLKSITPDAFALVLCHEIGHFIGGAPVYGNQAITPAEEALSAEGQADYWASAKCLRRLFSDQNNIGFMKEFRAKYQHKFIFKEMLPIVSRKCEKVWFNSKNKKATCERTIMAARSFSRTARIRGNEKFWINITTPSQVIAPQTYLFHSPAQCRFDTYVAGALCEVPETVKASFDDLNDGVCSRSKGHTFSARPLCWFKPDL